MKFKTIGIIGAGTMGIGITADLILRGLKVVLVDISEQALKDASNEIVKVVRFAPLVKKMDKVLPVEEAIKNVTFTTKLGDVNQCEFIIENVTENKKIKEKVYRELDKICAKNVLFAVNTSCISITEIGSITNRSDKVIGMHFMNPVILKSAIEVIKGFNTSEETVEIGTEFLKEIGKEPIVINDFPGFVSNRISHLFMNEAAFTVQDQVASPKQVDEIFKKCYGHTMGPLETADLIGLDTVVNSLDVLYESYQDPKYRCCPLLRKMVQAGLLGRKSGQGFYKY